MLNLCSYFLQESLLPANVANRHDFLLVPSFLFSELSQIQRFSSPSMHIPLPWLCTRHLDFASQRVPLIFKNSILLILSEIGSYDVLFPVPVHYPCLTSTLLKFLLGLVLQKKSVLLYPLCVVLCDFQGKKWDKY